jgi:hypothetical protein
MQDIVRNLRHPTARGQRLFGGNAKPLMPLMKLLQCHLANALVVCSNPRRSERKRM